MSKKRKKTKKRSYLERAMTDPNIAILDFDHLGDRAPYQVQGTAKDLIRDGYDVPQRWMHNVHAQPDDRRKAFLVGRGWSATDQKRRFLNQNGVPVMAINDYPDDPYMKPRYWCSGDPPSYFGTRVWQDDEVMKFAPLSAIEIACPREDAYEPKYTAKDAPNVHFFHHVNNETELESWLHLPYIAWGTTVWGERVPKPFFHGGAARSSMLIGLRLLWHLGYREVYLLGCDCTPHHHPYPKYWETMFHVIEQLKPTFDRWGFKVYQTNADSHLRTFEFKTFREAVDS